MDNTQTNDNQDSIIADPLVDVKPLADKFCNESLDSLISEYGEKKLFEKTFAFNEQYFSVYDELKIRQKRIIHLFWPSELPFTLSTQQKRQIISLLANQQFQSLEQINSALQQIDPNLAVRQDINLPEIANESVKIDRAFQNLENLILNRKSYDYLSDTLAFFKLNDQEIAALEPEIKTITEKLAKQLENYAQNKFDLLDENLQPEALAMLGKLGRSKLFISEQKDKKNIGKLVEIFSLLDIAMAAAKALKSQNIPLDDNLDEKALEAIKTELKPFVTI